MQALWMVLGAFFFATMGVAVKHASEIFNAAEIVFSRGFIGVTVMFIVLRVRGITLATPVPKMHFFRNVIGCCSLLAWFYSIGFLPLATAMTLNYMSSIWIAAFLVAGALIYGKTERLGLLLGTVLLGFLGVVLALRPAFSQSQYFAGLVGLLSGIGSALAYLQIAAIGRAGEPEGRTVFYFSVGNIVMGVLATAFMGHTAWEDIRFPQALWVLPAGFLGVLGQWCMTRAYGHGQTLVVSSLQYSGIVFASLYSLLLFGDQIPPSGWLGIALIVFSGVTATILRTRTAAATTAAGDS
jgi:S-adenosylmethionine uptake transporter